MNKLIKHIVASLLLAVHLFIFVGAPFFHDHHSNNHQTDHVEFSVKDNCLGCDALLSLSDANLVEIQTLSFTNFEYPEYLQSTSVFLEQTVFSSVCRGPPVIA